MEALLKRREMKESAPGKEQEELFYTVRQDDLAGAPTDKDEKLQGKALPDKNTRFGVFLVYAHRAL